MLPTFKPYIDNDPEFQRIMRRLHNARTKTVVHHETCPCCKAKLVNLYRKSPDSGEWKCRKCWEKYEQELEKATENDTPACKTCQVHADALKSAEPAACAWYVENVVCGDKSVKSCPNYKPAEVDSNG